MASHVCSSAVPAAAPSGGPLTALAGHWPEYLIEAWALGTFMVSAGVFATLLGYPGSPLVDWLPDESVRRVLGGLAMGLTAIALIYSPWGQRSGAHMNPAVTLTFLRLGKVKPWDAVFFMLAQVAGGLVGVLLVLAAAGAAFADPPVRYAATVPGPAGIGAAFAAEFAISAALMTVILAVSNSARFARWTGVCAGVLVAIWIAVESPYSGMSMNPARSFASALPAGTWTGFWIYVAAPVLGMQAGALAWLKLGEGRRAACAKLQHPPTQRCIHCGYRPPADAGRFG